VVELTALFDLLQLFTKTKRKNITENIMFLLFAITSVFFISDDLLQIERETGKKVTANVHW
jgi:hypothetical protein